MGSYMAKGIDVAGIQILKNSSKGPVKATGRTGSSSRL